MNISVKRHILYIFLGFIFISFTSSFVIIETKSEVPNPENPENKPEFFRNKSITDGPYIFYENEEIIVRWIKWNRLVERVISGNNSKLLKRNFGFEIDSYYLKNGVPDSVNYNQTYNGVEKFAAISDIHGQYDLFVQLLKNHKIIDSHLNWIYGKGHLVILGDIMDRGDKVTELLWLTYKLEKQAEKEGGKVHYMVGNHELMVLNNDIRYIHEKYTSTAHEMNILYSQLFAKNTFFGQWLCTKPVIITINDVLFVHAGISAEFISNGLSIEQTNKLFHQNILGKSWDVILNDPLSAFLIDNNGPVWHRGYFESTIKEFQIEYILKYFNTKHVIIGHTSMPNIISLFDNKIIGIDSNIKEGNYGEILIYTNGEFYRGTSNGNLMKLEQINTNAIGN